MISLLKKREEKDNKKYQNATKILKAHFLN